MGSFSYGWIELIIEMTIKATLILGTAFTIILIWKRASASLRHFILCFSIISILILPWITFILPSWNVSIFPPIFQNDNSLSVQNPEEQVSSFQHFLPEAFPDIKQNTDSGAISDTFIKKSGRPISWPVLIIIIWLTGAFGVLIRLLTGLSGSWWIIKNSSALHDAPLENFVLQHKRKMNIKRNIRLLQSKKVVVPLTWGWLRPAIVFPCNVSGWSEERVRIVLLHELAHIKRGDILSTVLTYISSIVYWYNPLVWITLRQLHYERERACDDFVLESGTKPSVYASHLLDMVKMINGKNRLCVAMAQKYTIENRLKTILSNKNNRTILKPSMMVLICSLAFSFLIPLASLQTIAQNDSTPLSIILNEINGEFEFTAVSPGSVGTTVINFYTEDKSLWAESFAEDFKVKLDLFKDKELLFYYNDRSNGDFQIRFIRNKDGKIIVCRVLNKQINLELIGVRPFVALSSHGNSDLTGIWKGLTFVEGGDIDLVFTLDINHEDSDITGELTDDMGYIDSRITGAKLTKNILSFTTLGNAPEGEIPMVFTIALAGDELIGFWRADPYSGVWNARRESHETVNLSGTWTGEINIPGDGIDGMTMTIEHVGQKFTGIISDEFGYLNKHPITDVKLKNNKLSYTTVISSLKGERNVVVKGTVKTDIIDGTWEIPEFNESGTWKVKRQGNEIGLLKDHEAIE